jgi:heptaprenyl diphosphate synthase
MERGRHVQARPETSFDGASETRAPDFLSRVTRCLSQDLAEAGRLGEVAGPMVLSRVSKRARARVVHALAGGGEPGQALVEAAAAVELIHAASLLHDDVVDGARERRGLPTAHVTWGPQLAVLAGDLCLTLAMRRLSALGSAAVARAVVVVDTMTRGVADELLGRRDLSLSLADWRNLADAKTGVLFGFAAWLAYHARGLDAAAATADLALRHFGVAFQAADDASDFDVATGETPLQDLVDGVPNLVVLSACRRVPGLSYSLRAAWAAQATGSGAPRRPDWGALAQALVATGALADAHALISDERRAGQALLEALQDARGGEDRQGVGEVLRWAAALAAVTSRPVAPNRLTHDKEERPC